MAFQVILEDLPELYHQLFPDFFSTKVPAETFATCNNCAMVCQDESRIEKLAMKPFKPDRKCCTYHPNIPNYLVGGLLQDANPLLGKGKNRMLVKIKNKIGVTPAGVAAPRKYNVLYNQSSGMGFGQSANLMCPYYHKENGNCTIWKYRETICSTFFCKSVANKNGKAFWDGIKSYLSHIQEALTSHVLLELGFSAAEVMSRFNTGNNSGRNALTAEDLDDLPPKVKEYSTIWKNWEGKEEELYIKAFEIVKALSKAEFNEIVGVQQKVLLKDLLERKSKMTEIPETLMLNPAQQHQLKEEKESFSVHFKEIDISFELPKVVFQYFDGSKPYQVVREELNEKEDIEMDEELILSLYQYNILIPKPKEAKKAS